MKRVDSPEILDSEDCPPGEAEKSLRDLCRMNRWFGGISTTRTMLDKVTDSATTHFSWLEVAAGYGEGPEIIRREMAHRGVEMDLTFLDRVHSHLLPDRRVVVADALALPFRDEQFDFVSCNLFTHHLDVPQLTRFIGQAFRVCRRALLINDLIRHPLHLALIYAGFPLMRSYVSRVDGVASVRRAYTPQEMLSIAASAFQNDSPPRIEIIRHYLFRMGVIIRKDDTVADKRPG